MTVRFEASEAADRFCSACMYCFDGDPKNCPECGADRPPAGWEPLRAAPYPYLGTRIDERYLLDRYLGAGASSRVYRAHDLRLDRSFALKILDLGGAHHSNIDESLYRFEKEIEALSRIYNPHVIKIYDSYELEDATPAMLTEFIEGETLRDILGGGQRLSIDSAIAVALQLVNGLHDAHEHGVIHRDIKPANVMIEKLPASGSLVRILDFGLVHFAETTIPTGKFWGTPAYAAPEQCRPGQPITPATDFYSLGCVLYHCVTGEPPFLAETFHETLRAHVEKPPPRLSEKTDRPIPDALDDVVHAMLQKSPVDRPREFSEMTSALKRSKPDDRNRHPAVEDDSLESISEPSVAKERISLVEATEVGTGNGVGGVDSEGARAAQLVRSIDVDELASDFSGTTVACELDDSGACAILTDSQRGVFVVNTIGETYFKSLSKPDSELRAIAPNIERGNVYGAGCRGAIYRWQLHGAKRSPNIVCRLETEIRNIALGATGHHLYVCSTSGAIVCVNVRIDTTETISTPPPEFTDLHVGPARNWLLASSAAGRLFTRPLGKDNSKLVEIDDVGSEIAAAGLDSNSATAVAVDRESQFHVYSVQPEISKVTIDPSLEEIRSVSITSNRQLIALSVHEPGITVWRIRRERLAERMPEIRTAPRD